MRNKTKNLVMIAVMTAVLAILSPMSIPLGTIPVTLSVFAVYLVGALLPTSSAMASIALYLVLGGIGLPIFSAYRGGPQMLVGPTGGYLVGYFILVFVVSMAVKHTQNLSLQMVFATIALFVFYVVGTLWYMVVTQSDFLSGLMICVVPFIIPDMCKMVAALSLAKVINKRMAKAGVR